MKIIHLIAGDYGTGRVEGFFDEVGDLISAWPCTTVSDPQWRDEFTMMLGQLGIEVVEATAEQREELQDALAVFYGM